MRDRSARPLQIDSAFQQFTSVGTAIMKRAKVRSLGGELPTLYVRAGVPDIVGKKETSWKKVRLPPDSGKGTVPHRFCRQKRLTRCGLLTDIAADFALLRLRVLE